MLWKLKNCREYFYCICLADFKVKLFFCVFFVFRKCSKQCLMLSLGMQSINLLIHFVVVYNFFQFWFAKSIKHMFFKQNYWNNRFFNLKMHFCSFILYFTNCLVILNFSFCNLFIYFKSKTWCSVRFIVCFI